MRKIAVNDKILIKNPKRDKLGSKKYF